MTMRRVAGSSAMVLSIALGAGCGGGGAGEARSPEPKTAATPAAHAPPCASPPCLQEDAARTAGPPPRAPAQPQPSAPPVAGATQSTTIASEPAWVDFTGAETALDASSGDCGAACRALGSMERACGRLCANTDQPTRCDDSRARVKAARGRIRATCRACVGGPSLDDKAPIPST